MLLCPICGGHGAAPEHRGDVDHIGQYEEDIADLIDAARQEGQKVVVAGHSSGGGLVVRMAGGTYRNRMDGVILLSPFLKYNAMTMRPNSGGWARPLTRRIIGLSMLNMVGIKSFNHLQVIQFAMPQSVLGRPAWRYRNHILQLSAEYWLCAACEISLGYCQPTAIPASGWP